MEPGAHAALRLTEKRVELLVLVALGLVTRSICARLSPLKYFSTLLGS